MTTTVVWLRDDLRLADNPALREAADDGDVVVLYVLDEESEGVRPLGGAARWWLHHSLVSLGESLKKAGVPLVLRRGASEKVLPEVLEEAKADAVVWNRRYGQPERDIDARIKEAAQDNDLEAHSFAANMLHEPWTVQTGSGEPFKVFTPYWKACLREPDPREPVAGVRKLSGPELKSDDLDDWELLPRDPDWSGGLAKTWEPGEAGAQKRLKDALDGGIADYDDGHDLPAEECTSRLSPHLRFGEVSPFQVLHAAAEQKQTPSLQAFLRQIYWRDFNWQMLYQQPDMAETNINRKYDAFPWRTSKKDLKAWQRGRTGIPLADAGMRQLWETGWMHNRVRLVTGSLLVKNLLLDWRDGEKWFWDTLVDADAANNPGNWQWVAGSGADAAPYFRVFNPVTQAKRFDPDGKYVREWVPELADSRGKEVIEPWAGSEPPADYPEPIVDLKESRRRALDAYDQLP